MTNVSLRDYIEAQWTAHRQEHLLDDRALTLAAEQAATNKADSNEWRAAMTDRERTFYTKAEGEALQARVDELREADIARTTRETERERSLLRTMAMLGLVVTVVSVVLNLLLRLLLG